MYRTGSARTWLDIVERSHARRGGACNEPVSPLSRNESIIEKFARAASEIKPVLQSARISEFNYKSKASPARRNTLVRANGLERKPNKYPWPFYVYPRSAGWTRLARRSKLTPKTLRRREKPSGAGFTSPLFSPERANPQTDIIKITTVIETIRRKRQWNAQLPEETNDIPRVIRSKRSKRSSSRAAGIDSQTAESSRRSEEVGAFVARKRSPYPRHRQDRQRQTYSRRDRATGRDLNAANNVAIPSHVFYKRIWEYINGTRPHSDIISGYDAAAEGESARDNSTCTDQERIDASRENQKRAGGVKPEREFYKRIWDIINATQSMYGHANARTKRQVTNVVPRDDVSSASSQPCAQGAGGRKAGNGEDERPRHRRLLDTPGTTTRLQGGTSDPAPHISGFWTVAGKTQWQPRTVVVPVVNLARLSDEPSRATVAGESAASEVADLTSDLAREAPANDYVAAGSTSTTTTVRTSTSNSEITEPGPPYLSRGENVVVSPSGADNASRTDEDAPARRTEERRSDATDNLIYDPSKIPYIEVPDYSDRQEEEDDSGNKGNRSTAADGYKEEYDGEGDYVDVADVPRYRGSSVDDDSSSEAPSAAIESPSPNTRGGNEEQRSSLSNRPDVARCAENADGADECADERDAEESRSGDDGDDDVRRPAEEEEEEVEDAAERENSAADFPPIHFDINEYKKPFDLNDFLKNDSVFESLRIGAEDAKQDDQVTIPGDDRRDDDGTEARARYATYPQERSRDYSTTNEDRRDDPGTVSDDRDEETATRNSDSHANEEERGSEEVTKEDYYPYDDKDFFKRIFGGTTEDDDEGSSSEATEHDFLSHHFTEDVLRQIRDNSTDEEDRKREESRNRENVYRTLSRILDKKNRFSRLNDDVDKMIENGEAVPIRYNNFWSLAYESPRGREAKAKEEDEEEEEEA